MATVVPIHEAKTNLSKLLGRVRAGETIYIGAYGRAEAILAPVPERRSIPVGIWSDRKDPNFDYGAEDLIGPDEEIGALFDAATSSR